MTAAAEVQPPIASLLLKIPQSECRRTIRQQLGKKRPRSSISETNDRVNIAEPNRKVHFFESSSLSSSSFCAQHSTHNDTDSAIGRSESANNDKRGTSTSIDNDNDNDNDNVWYSKSELAEFTRQARDHVLGLDHKWENTDRCTRGYERYDFARAQQKAMTRNIILLLMQQKSLSDEEKSLIAHRSSAWAVDEAFLTGCKDFCEAYHPHVSHLLVNSANDAAATNAVNTTTGTHKKEGNNKRKRMEPSNHQSNEHRNLRLSA